MPRALSSSLVAVGCAAVLVTAAPTAGATARTFRQASAKDFADGEATGTTILPDGEIVPGLLTERAGVEAAFVWCATPSRDGATVFFGTGDEGKLFALPAKGSADKDGALPGARKLASLDAAWVTALATRADGVLLAGATPGGKVWAVNPKDGAARVLGTVPAAHVWTLARDDKAGLTYVGTGAPGKIFALDDQGRARQVWDAHDKHVVALVRDSDGTLLAGTSESAILYRVRPDGQATALQDFEAEEVRAIVRAPSGLYVAVNDFDKATPAAAAPVPAKGTKIVLSTGGPPPSAGALPRAGQRKARSAVYRLEADGRIEQVFSLGDSYLTALAVAEDGAVLAASGADGHVFRIAPEGTSSQVSLVIDVPERQALALARVGGDVWVGTGDAAGVYRARVPGAGKGHYLSKVLDAEYQARWGALHWQGAGVTFETRSGNTAKPDAGWNGWKALARRADKSNGHDAREAGGGAGAVDSPPARYLQYRATLGAATARLRGVTVFYLPQNQRARITELTLADSAPAASTTTTTTTATAPPARGAQRDAEAALEGREPGRRRPHLPAALPGAGGCHLAAAGRRGRRSADQGGVRLEHGRRARRPVRGARGGVRRARAARRARAVVGLRLGAAADRQSQADGARPDRALPGVAGDGPGRRQPHHATGVRRRRGRLAAALAWRRHRRRAERAVRRAAAPPVPRDAQRGGARHRQRRQRRRRGCRDKGALT